MFWDKIAFLYDLFETVYNKKCFQNLGYAVADLIDEKDNVLECACGTGAISLPVAEKCHCLVATDFSVKMLKQARQKCSKCKNIIFRKADITSLNCSDSKFDKVIAGNVIHLLDEPQKAMKELERVCKSGGMLIIPTYINKNSDGSDSIAVKFLEKLGADFSRQFTLDEYKSFFFDMGYDNAEFFVVDGRMPCAVAVISVK